MESLLYHQQTHANQDKKKKKCWGLRYNIFNFAKTNDLTWCSWQGFSFSVQVCSLILNSFTLLFLYLLDFWWYVRVWSATPQMILSKHILALDNDQKTSSYSFIGSKHRQLFRLIPSMFGNSEALLSNPHVRLDAHHEISQDLLNWLNLKSSFKGNFPHQGGNIPTVTF